MSEFYTAYKVVTDDKAETLLAASPPGSNDSYDEQQASERMNAANAASQRLDLHTHYKIVANGDSKRVTA